jgi:hypothetical protein
MTMGRHTKHSYLKQLKITKTDVTMYRFMHYNNKLGMAGNTYLLTDERRRGGKDEGILVL